ncbi:group III truncated hemoglobin [Pontibacter sp. JH31]|uniref:Group III truncated hemoglobin n=1 Tax=Pontibacter aquaedesilientis TaxID=2766980 RepID=A0ABR7XJP6_9BACT|nr:group III truncated hemoglobin [Pontibacter aquaedesilientis]MBD1398539.1 group III truncated hemoglobin [Pontibacter aquaedesilientis]
MKGDITGEQDIKLLVDTFYGKVNDDELLGPIFNGFAQVNWEHHLPVMYSFWSSVLFGTMAYKGQPFPKHMRLPINRQHFARWVELFTQTADELFEGQKTQELKQKASSIAQIFQMKMGLIGTIGNKLTD